MKDILIFVIIAVICGAIYVSVTEVSIARAFFVTFFMSVFWGGYIFWCIFRKSENLTRGDQKRTSRNNSVWRALCEGQRQKNETL